MKLLRRKILALTLAFSFLWMGMAPAFASFGDSCCRHHSLSASRQNDRSGLVSSKNQSCGCGGNNPRPTCSDRSVAQASYMGHPIMKRTESMTQMLSYLFDELIPRIEIAWAGPPCCDIEKAPMSSTHDAPILFTSSRFEKSFFVVLSKISECPGSPAGFNRSPPLIRWGTARASLTPIYLDNNAFLI